MGRGGVSGHAGLGLAVVIKKVRMPTRQLTHTHTHNPHTKQRSSALVGETLESGGAITGARVVDKSKNRRPEYRLEVWTRSKVSKGVPAACVWAFCFVWWWDGRLVGWLVG